MIKCPLCQARYVANTVFCGECGSYLLKDNTHNTVIDPVSRRRFRTNQPEPDTPEIEPQPQINNDFGTLRLKIGVSQREVEIALDKAIYVGRIAPAINVFPEIDLSDQGLLANTVSRRHAKISKRGNVVVIEDLDSRNGTYINGEQLCPFLPETLNHGDTLHLGKVLIEVEFLPVSQIA